MPRKKSDEKNKALPLFLIMGRVPRKSITAILLYKFSYLVTCLDDLMTVLVEFE